MAASSSSKPKLSGHVDQKAFSFCDYDEGYVIRCPLCYCLFVKKWYDYFYLIRIQITPDLKASSPLCKKCIKQLENHKIVPQEIRSKLRKIYRKTI